MAQYLSQDRRSRNGSDAAWLALLIDSFERVSHSHSRGTPCDAALINAAKARLSRPASAYSTGSASAHLN